MKKNSIALVAFNIASIALVFAIIAGGIMAFTSLTGFSSSEKHDSVSYEVEIKKIKIEVSDNISVGDTVIDSVGKYEIGTVDRVERTPTEIPKYDGEGNMTGKTVLSGYEDIIVYVSSLADISDKQINVGGYVLKVGKTMYLRFPEFVGEGICVRINQNPRER